MHTHGDMETFTTQDMLINSTDLNRILCNVGFGNSSECASTAKKDINQAVRIILYTLIFLLSVLGNSLIIAVLVNRRMRTVTNMFLLSLAVSDLMVALVCIPFTLIPNIMKNFIFGVGTCKLVMYFMGVSVSVSTFNLVAISLERYSAICHPFKSMVWQTKSHAAKVITATWGVSFLLMLPYPVFSTLKPFVRFNNSTGHMCRLLMPSNVYLQSWYLSLLLILFLIPGIGMLTAYGLISVHLWQGGSMAVETRKSARDREGSIKPGDGDGCYLQPSRRSLKGAPADLSGKSLVGRMSISSSQIVAKKRVIRMLMVIVLLFFVCWTPIFVVNALQAFDRQSVLHLTGAPISFIHLLSYTSSCVNPIIYCFMNKRFREAMLATLCFKKPKQQTGSSVRSAVGSRIVRAERPEPKTLEKNGHSPPSSGSTQCTYTGSHSGAWSELT